MTARSRVVRSIVLVVLLAFAVFAADQNQIEGTVNGQPIGQPSRALSGISIRAFAESGTEEDATQTGNGGAFNVRLPATDPIYRLLVWDDLNRWWPRDLKDLHNDPAHTRLAMIVLRPQSELLPPAERTEQSSIILWLKKHNPLSAALLEVHLGAYDRTSPPGPFHLNGAGPVEGSPALMAWNSAYEQLHPEVGVNYQSIGSGGGIRQLSDGTVDFGTSSVPLSNDQLAHIPSRVYQLPVALGAVVIVYRGRPLPANIRFTGPVLAKIFLGKIISWNDPALKEINRGIDLPALPIVSVHRNDGTAATLVFSDYLSKVSAEWKERLGSGSSISWPTGIGVKGNEGVAGILSQTEGGLGYLDFAYAQDNHLAASLIQNRAERYVMPSRASISAAALNAQTSANWLPSITDAPGLDSYPLSSMSWFLVPSPRRDPKKTFVLLDYINLSLSETSVESHGLGYVPLPSPLVAKVKNQLNEIARDLLDETSGANP